MVEDVRGRSQSAQTQNSQKWPPAKSRRPVPLNDFPAGTKRPPTPAAGGNTPGIFPSSGSGHCRWQSAPLQWKFPPAAWLAGFTLAWIRNGIHGAAPIKYGARDTDGAQNNMLHRGGSRIKLDGQQFKGSDASGVGEPFRPLVTRAGGAAGSAAAGFPPRAWRRELCRTRRPVTGGESNRAGPARCCPAAAADKFIFPLKYPSGPPIEELFDEINISVVHR